MSTCFLYSHDDLLGPDPDNRYWWPVVSLTGVNGDGKEYTCHDPCYLGRHNEVYDDPRAALDAISGLKRVEMMKSRDRSFCCGGGGLMLFYEPEEEQRRGVLWVQMAAEAGANVIVTAYPKP